MDLGKVPVRLPIPWALIVRSTSSGTKHGAASLSLSSCPAVGCSSSDGPSLDAPSLGAPCLGAPSLGAPCLGAPSLGAPSLGVPSPDAPSLVASTSVEEALWECADCAIPNVPQEAVCIGCMQPRCMVEWKFIPLSSTGARSSRTCQNVKHVGETANMWGALAADVMECVPASYACGQGSNTVIADAGTSSSTASGSEGVSEGVAKQSSQSKQSGRRGRKGRARKGKGRLRGALGQKNGQGKRGGRVARKKQECVNMEGRSNSSSCNRDEGPGDDDNPDSGGSWGGLPWKPVFPSSPTTATATAFDGDLPSRALLMILLTIGGVEMNPGPFQPVRQLCGKWAESVLRTSWTQQIPAVANAICRATVYSDEESAAKVKVAAVIAAALAGGGAGSVAYAIGDEDLHSNMATSPNMALPSFASAHMLAGSLPDAQPRRSPRNLTMGLCPGSQASPPFPQASAVPHSPCTAMEEKVAFIKGWSKCLFTDYPNEGALDLALKDLLTAAGTSTAATNAVKRMVADKLSVCRFHTCKVFTCGHVATQRVEGYNSKIKRGDRNNTLRTATFYDTTKLVFTLQENAGREACHELVTCIQEKREWSQFVKKKWDEEFQLMDGLHANIVSEDDNCWHISVFPSNRPASSHAVFVPKGSETHPTCSCPYYTSILIPCRHICVACVFVGKSRQAADLPPRWLIRYHPWYGTALSTMGIEPAKESVAPSLVVPRAGDGGGDQRNGGHGDDVGSGSRDNAGKQDVGDEDNKWMVTSEEYHAVAVPLKNIKQAMRQKVTQAGDELAALVDGDVDTFKYALAGLIKWTKIVKKRKADKTTPAPIVHVSGVGDVRPLPKTLGTLGRPCKDMAAAMNVFTSVDK
eukprot:jgi/Mesvir1/9400/Mv25674-RA.1